MGGGFWWWGVGWFVGRFVRVFLLMFVLLTLRLALPFFFDLMSLGGSFSTGLLGFVLPTLIYLRLKGTELSAAKKALNYGICALGAFGGLYCSWEVLVGMMAR